MFKKLGKEFEYYNFAFLIYCMYTALNFLKKLPRGKVFEKFGEGEVEYYNSAFLTYCLYTSP